MCDLFNTKYDKDGCIVLPDVFAKVLSDDAKFETVSSNLSRKLKLQRQDTIVGHKRLFYAIDKADETRKGTREYVMNFFIESLGFTKEEIILVDRNEFRQEIIELKRAKTGKKEEDKWLFN